MDQLGPQFWVQDIKRSIAFYRDVLGFTVRGELEAEPTHVSMLRGEASIMLAPLGNNFDGAWPAADVAAGRRGNAGAVLFYIEAGDIDADFAHVQAKGATVVDALAAKPWGQREFTIEDPDGFLWALWKQSAAPQPQQ